jgi:hypothetical protein
VFNSVWGGWEYLCEVNNRPRNEKFLVHSWGLNAISNDFLDVRAESAKSNELAAFGAGLPILWRLDNRLLAHDWPGRGPKRVKRQKNAAGRQLARVSATQYSERSG